MIFGVRAEKRRMRDRMVRMYGVVKVGSDGRVDGVVAKSRLEGKRRVPPRGVGMVPRRCMLKPAGVYDKCMSVSIEHCDVP